MTAHGYDANLISLVNITRELKTLVLSLFNRSFGKSGKHKGRLVYLRSVILEYAFIDRFADRFLTAATSLSGNNEANLTRWVTGKGVVGTRRKPQLFSSDEIQPGKQDEQKQHLRGNGRVRILH